jgi:triosephosphate isomerase (TIM)
MAPTRRPLIAGNWKMNLNHLEAIALTQKIAFSLSEAQLTAAEVVLLPPFVDLRSVQTLIDGDRMLLGYGGQDLSPHDSGAYTGDISGPMLSKLGCTYVIVGHSERRQYHAETDEVVNAKVKAAFKNGLVPIVCVGEQEHIRKADGAVQHCTRQAIAALDGASSEQVEKVVVAYEPIWAIGTGQVATPEDAQEVCSAIRGELANVYGNELAAGVRILYGGSVKAGNARELLAPPDIDGALVGGASLDASEFAAICAATLPAAS